MKGAAAAGRNAFLPSLPFAPRTATYTCACRGAPPAPWTGSDSRESFEQRLAQGSGLATRSESAACVGLFRTQSMALLGLKSGFDPPDLGRPDRQLHQQGLSEARLGWPRQVTHQGARDPTTSLCRSLALHCQKKTWSKSHFSKSHKVSDRNSIGHLKEEHQKSAAWTCTEKKMDASEGPHSGCAESTAYYRTRQGQEPRWGEEWAALIVNIPSFPKFHCSKLPGAGPDSGSCRQALNDASSRCSTEL